MKYTHPREIGKGIFHTIIMYLMDTLKFISSSLDGWVYRSYLQSHVLSVD